MRTNEEWKAIFADHEASGMTVKEYCKEHNIGVASFYKYKKLIMQSRNDCFEEDYNAQV